jgi:integrase
MPTIRGMTDAAAKRLKAPAKGQVDYFDPDFPGLVLRVSCGGRKVWTYNFRFHGQKRRMTLDLYPVMGVAQAHDAWRKALDMVRAGSDPSRPQEKATDFKGVFEEWMARDQEGRGHRSAGIVRHRIEREVLPQWGNRSIAEIGRRDVLDAIDAVADRGAVISARRLHSHLHRLFRWAVGRGIIETNPLADLPKPGSETKRDRVLSDAELVKVWQAAEKLGYPYGPAIKLLVLTGGRREEIGQLRWSEIEGGTIHLSGKRTKNSEPHIIPLSPVAQSVLAEVPRINEFVFTLGKTPLNSWSRVKRKLDGLAALAEPWVVHDLRRTTATGLQRLRVALEVTESVLGHTSGSRAGVVGIYQRHDYAEEKAEALDKWGARVIALVEGREPCREPAEVRRLRA